MHPGATSVAAFPVAAGGTPGGLGSGLTQVQAMSVDLSPGVPSLTVPALSSDHIVITVSYNQIAMNYLSAINVAAA
jgi:hypothetical protein